MRLSTKLVLVALCTASYTMAAPVSMLTRGLAHAAAGGVRCAPNGRARVRFAVRWAGRPSDAPPLGTGEDRRSGLAGGTCLPPGARKAPGPYGGTPGYRCVSEALCFPVCYGDKLWSPCMRGRSDGKPLDEFAVSLGSSSTF